MNIICARVCVFRQSILSLQWHLFIATCTATVVEKRLPQRRQLPSIKAVQSAWAAAPSQVLDFHHSYHVPHISIMHGITPSVQSIPIVPTCQFFFQLPDTHITIQAHMWHWSAQTSKQFHPYLQTLQQAYLWASKRHTPSDKSFYSHQSHHSLICQDFFNQFASRPPSGDSPSNNPATPLNVTLRLVKHPCICSFFLPAHEKEGCSSKTMPYSFRWCRTLCCCSKQFEGFVP